MNDLKSDPRLIESAYEIITWHKIRWLADCSQKLNDGIIILMIIDIPVVENKIVKTRFKYQFYTFFDLLTTVSWRLKAKRKNKIKEKRNTFILLASGCKWIIAIYFTETIFALRSQRQRHKVLYVHHVGKQRRQRHTKLWR